MSYNCKIKLYVHNKNYPKKVLIAYMCGSAIGLVSTREMDKEFYLEVLLEE